MEQFDQTWIERLQEGDQAAFRFFYDLYSPALWRHLLRMLGEEALAEEVFQETFILVLKKLDFYSPRNELTNSFRSWVFRLATNRAIDEIRALKRRKREREAKTLATEPRVEQRDLIGCLEGLISRLPSMQRTFLNLKVKEEMNYKEIADICGCSVGAVKQGVFRARVKLKELMEEEGIVT